MAASFTVLPFLTVLSGPPDTTPGFDWSFRPIADGYAPTTYINSLGGSVIGQPLTVSLTQHPEVEYSRINDIGLMSAYGQALFFITYREMYNNPAAAILFRLLDSVHRLRSQRWVARTFYRGATDVRLSRGGALASTAEG
jgi:hypothetical protein